MTSKFSEHGTTANMARHDNEFERQKLGAIDGYIMTMTTILT